MDKLDRGDYSELRAFNMENTDTADLRIKTEKNIHGKKIQKTIIKKQKTGKKHTKNLKKNVDHLTGIRKNMIFYYRKFCKAVYTLPGYMQDNLETMPNNKGYIWRSVCFFGKQKPIKGEPHILFEKQKGVLIIHKTYKTYEEVYKKKG